MSLQICDYLLGRNTASFQISNKTHMLSSDDFKGKDRVLKPCPNNKKKPLKLRPEHFFFSIFGCFSLV